MNEAVAPLAQRGYSLLFRQCTPSNRYMIDLSPYLMATMRDCFIAQGMETLALIWYIWYN